jgi:glycerol-1-phosphatase
MSRPDPIDALGPDPLPEQPFVPAEHFDVALLDLDGVVYVGDDAVDFAAESILAAGELRMRPAYVTNNASRTPQTVADHLSRLGIPARSEDVVTSAQAGAHALQRLLAAEGLTGPVLAVGGPGVSVALQQRGLIPTDSADDLPVAVLQGFGPDVGWSHLREASIAVGRGARWVATNPDLSIPTPRGRAPGNGAFVQAVSVATGRQPDLIAGKPYPPLVQESIERTRALRPLMIGDRLDTDIEAGHRSGVRSMLVMTGVSDLADVVFAARSRRPDLISVDLRGLLTTMHPVTQSTDGFVCGRIRVTRSTETGHWTVHGDGWDQDPEVWAQAARCLCAAVWGAVDEIGEGEHVTQMAADAMAALQRALGMLVSNAGR